jgi:hypothetical protein
LLDVLLGKAIGRERILHKIAEFVKVEARFSLEYR